MKFCLFRNKNLPKQINFYKKRPTFYIPPYNIESRKKHRQIFYVKEEGIQNNKSDQIYTVSNCLNKHALTNIYVVCVSQNSRKKLFPATQTTARKLGA
jgi:hypothetical protein